MTAESSDNHEPSSLDDLGVSVRGGFIKRSGILKRERCGLRLSAARHEVRRTWTIAGGFRGALSTIVMMIRPAESNENVGAKGARS